MMLRINAGSKKENRQIVPTKKSRKQIQIKQLSTVGGHSENFSHHQDGFLTKKTNHTEARFYKQLMHQKPGLTNFTARCTDVRYEGASAYKDNSSIPSTVTIEDLRQGFVKPLIYDIKLGTKTASARELRATGATKAQILRKDFMLRIADTFSSSKKRGYRFVGCSALDESRTHLGTHPDEMIKNFGQNISGRDVAKIIDELDRLSTYLKTPEGRSFELIGASVLVVVESDLLMQVSRKANDPKVKLIDFAHSNIITSNDHKLDNGLFNSFRRKRIYQNGMRRGVDNLADDLRLLLEE